MSFLAGQAVTDQSTDAPAAAYITAQLDDTDNTNITLNFTGSQLANGDPVNFATCEFKATLYCRDVIQTDSVGPSATLTPRGGSPAEFRVGVLTMGPGTTLNLTPDPGFSDVGDQAIVEGAFSYSNGILSYSKKTVSDVMQGITGSATNYLDAAGFHKVQLSWTGGSQTFYEGGAHSFEELTFTDNAETPANDPGAFQARKFIRDYYSTSVRLSTDSSSGGAEAVDTYQMGAIQTTGKNQGGVSGSDSFVIGSGFFEIQATEDVVNATDDGNPDTLSHLTFLVTGTTESRPYHPRSTLTVNGGLTQFAEKSTNQPRQGVGDAEDAYHPRSNRNNSDPNVNGHAINWEFDVDVVGDAATILGAIAAGDRIAEAKNQADFSLFSDSSSSGTAPLVADIPLRELGVDEIVTVTHFVRSANDTIGATTSTQFRLSGTF